MSPRFPSPAIDQMLARGQITDGLREESVGPFTAGLGARPHRVQLDAHHPERHRVRQRPAPQRNSR